MAEESDDEKLLGIALDTKLSFKTHLKSLCREAIQKLYALSRILILMVLLSHFIHCSVVWMLHDRKIDNKTKKIQEPLPRISYRDNASHFNELLEKDNTLSIHQKELQVLTIEIYKAKK